MVYSQVVVAIFTVDSHNNPYSLQNPRTFTQNPDRGLFAGGGGPSGPQMDDGEAVDSEAMLPE